MRRLPPARSEPRPRTRPPSENASVERPTPPKVGTASTRARRALDAGLRVPLRWLTADERGPALLRSGRKTEELVDKGPLRRQVIPGRGAHLALGQHRHRL